MAGTQGVGFEGIIGRETAGFGNQWGTPRASLLQRVLNAVIPVSIVNRFYGELEGSMGGISAGISNLRWDHRPAIELFSIERDWLLHRLNVWVAAPMEVFGGNDPRVNIAIHMFSPDASYNPIEIDPTPIFYPALITNPSGDLGTVRAQGGSNEFESTFGTGFIIYTGTFVANTYRSNAPWWDFSDAYLTDHFELNIGKDGQGKGLTNTIVFDPPLRMLRYRPLDIQVTGPDISFAQYSPGFELIVSAMFSEIPNPRGV